MKVVFGLGNPGKKYELTRHNVGFMMVNQLAPARKWHHHKKGQLLYIWIKADNKKIKLVKPLTFMNGSGKAVKYICQKQANLQTTDLWVIHDDLDLPLGEYKIQLGKGPKLHHGLISIEQAIKTNNFWRLRIGVKGEYYQQVKEQGKTMADDYLLKPFSQTERDKLDQVFVNINRELFNKLTD